LIRRASINGSGYGGTDTHVILEAWTEPAKVIESTSKIEGRAPRGQAIAEPITTGPKVFVWSHQRDDGFSKLANAWKKFIKAAKANRQELSLDDLAYTLSTRRTRFAQRAAVVASNIEELLDGLNKIELGSLRPVKALTNARTCFIFTGKPPLLNSIKPIQADAILFRFRPGSPVGGNGTGVIVLPTLC
jgi:emericellamide synthase (highly reducing iterative type I polyketide synthase)